MVSSMQVYAAATPVERFQSRIDKDAAKVRVSYQGSQTRQTNNQMASQRYQPVNNSLASMEFSGNAHSTNGAHNQSGVLNEIQRMGDIAVDNTATQVNKFNQDRRRQMEAIVARNQAMRAQSGGTASGAVQYNPVLGGQQVTLSGSLQGLGLTAHQMHNARTIMDVGRKRGLSTGDITIGIMTALAESGLKNVSYGDRDSLGLFQQRHSMGWGTQAQIMNPVYSANKFYDALSRVHGGNPWMRAQLTQRSAFADGSNYRAQYSLAQRIVGAATIAAQTAGSSQTKTAAAGWINQNEFKYHDFDGWYGAQCVDLFNFYNKGFVGGGFTSGVAGAKDIWGNPNMNRNYVAVGRNQRAQMGDVVVYGSSWGGGYGHVGIVVSDQGGTLKVLNANATSAGSKGLTVISTLSKNGMLGYYRPRKLMMR